MQPDKSKELAWMTKPGNNFCAMPFIHMAIEANGDVLPCCMGKPLKGLNIRNKTVGEVFNDPVRKEFIESFKRNEQHPACEVCWKDPHSIRGKFSTSFASIDFTRSIMNGADPKEQLQWLEIKAGNRCNLKCRICGVHNSSAWAKDNHTFRNMNNDIKFKDSFAYKLTQSCDWIDDPKFWNDLEQMESLKYLHFMGGEPFMVPEHFQLIQALVDNPDIDTSQTIIGYNTNGTYFPTKENFELYRNFKEVIFALSIDDIGPRFEYQRKIAEWQKVRNNIVNFKKRSTNDFINDEGYENIFSELTRNAFLARTNKECLSRLVDWSQNTSKLEREEIKNFLLYSNELFRQAFLKNVGLNQYVTFETNSNFNFEGFSNYITEKNIELINVLFEESHYNIKRNANSKMVLTNLAFDLTKLIHA